MAELVIQCPGQPEQVLALSEAAVSVGRAQDCTAFIAEKKASRKHLTVRMLAGKVVAEDQGSSNGTWIVGERGEQRFLRRSLELGDVLRIGDTRILVRESTEAAPEAPLVSGTLQLTPASSEPTPAAAPAADAPPPQPEISERPLTFEAVWEGEPRADRAAEKRALARGLVICGIAVAVLVGVEILLGSKAEKKSARREAHIEALRILEDVNKSAEHFQRRRDDFAARYPRSPDLFDIDRYLELMREREAYAKAKHHQLDDLLASGAEAPRSERRFLLLQLKRELPEDELFKRRIYNALQGLDRERTEEDLDALRVLEQRVEAMLAANQPALAARLVRAFDRAQAGVNGGVKDRWTALRDRVSAVITKDAAELWKRVDAEQDPAKRRVLLADAWSALAGTAQGDRIGDRLRSAASLAAPRSGRPGVPTRPGARPGTGPAPPVPTVTDQLLARARVAEQLLQKRDWGGGRAALARLVNEVEGGRLHGEWKQRLAEVDQVIGLVNTLSESAGQEKKPRCKLSSGSWTILGATPTDVTLESKKKGLTVHRWADMPEADILKLLTPKRISKEQRHAVAVLAANLGDRKAFVAALLPIYEKGGDLAATNRLVARHLHGRSTPPKGGYGLYKGEILDQAGIERVQRQERIAWLRVEADAVLALIAKEGAFKRLGKLRSMRDELDKRREYALLAIFNTKHYPYPVAKNARYWAVQQEIDKRVAKAREIWDLTYSVKIKRDGKLGKLLDRWDAALVELDAKEVDIADLQKKIAPYAMYVTGEPITIRDFYRTKGEKDWHAYSRWVMAEYNPARSEYASDSERKQVQITNTYRMLMGYTAIVKPGEAPYESIDKDNVVKILDTGVVQKMTLLRAVRVDNRLMTSARMHSQDMSMRGYFAHQAPANPATGEGPTGPADRMQKQGYRGWGYSENIASSSSPQQAHNMWIHSSGHHRNILSGWTDLGSGVGGRNFTQNFGNGGGARPQVYPDTKIRQRDGPGRGGRRRPRGQ